FAFVVFIGTVLFAYALVAKLLARSPISGPMFFAFAGLVAYWVGIIPAETATFTESIALLLELTLALVLFTDSMTLNLGTWRDDGELPSRLLAIGMPFMIALGAVAAVIMFPDLDLWGAMIVATILAPTDAALGRPVVTNERVPLRIREALNIESGLNDGIALPFLLFFIAGAEAEEGANLFALFGSSVGWALVAGIGIGWVAARAVVWFSDRGWMPVLWRQISVVAVAFVAYFVADEIGGSGFIAAFVAGLVFGRVTRDRGFADSSDMGDFGDTLAQFLTMIAFFIFGALILAPTIGIVTLPIVLYAVVSLAVVRMIAVAISMIRAGLRPPTIAYMGWFGPRGLASIIFGTIVVEEAAIPHTDLIVTIMVVTVALSILLHGITAYSGSNAYADWYEERGGDEADMIESEDIESPIPRPRITGP
ncbi:MAG: cation:proton antiporter, partial [Actinomycetota bacterium]|nr:cation:proton antiporter [Actinomycetota bacterium]